MLSSALHSPRAIKVNIAIMRAFVRLREILVTHKDVAHKRRRIGFAAKLKWQRSNAHSLRGNDDEVPDRMGLDRRPASLQPAEPLLDAKILQPQQNG